MKIKDGAETMVVEGQPDGSAWIRIETTDEPEGNDFYDSLGVRVPRSEVSKLIKRLKEIRNSAHDETT